jgi:hypothetical protein
MGYYDNILNLISVVLALSILFIIIFGCQFKKYRHLERFTNAGDEEKPASDEKKDETPSPSPPQPPPQPPSPSPPKTETTELPPFEKKIYEGLKSGTMSDADMQDLIDKDIFKRENLEMMLDYMEKFKNKS